MRLYHEPARLIRRGMAVGVCLLWHRQCFLVSILGQTDKHWRRSKSGGKFRIGVVDPPNHFHPFGILDWPRKRSSDCPPRRTLLK